jgi:hypothetical protein
VNWKRILPLPLAALVLGSPLHAPQLRVPIPVLQDLVCDHDKAVRDYLDAFAYSEEDPGRAARLLDSAERERTRCLGDSSVLQERIGELRKRLGTSAIRP